MHYLGATPSLVIRYVVDTIAEGESINHSPSRDFCTANHHHILLQRSKIHRYLGYIGKETIYVYVLPPQAKVYMLERYYLDVLFQYEPSMATR